MKTAQRTRFPERTQPTRVESVKFHDGMLVTADDLDTAQRYPATLLQAVFRAYFGCGVVCGLGLTVKQPWVVRIDRGVAIDCQGHPIELCMPIELDLSPEKCGCETPPERWYVLVGRVTSEEAAHDPCGCDTDDPRFDCRRGREHTAVKGVDALPDNVCQRDTDEKRKDPCAALTGCHDCGCDHSWVLLGSVSREGDKQLAADPDLTGRRWVKPVELLCSNVLERIKKLEAASTKPDRP